jgi:hypothetical protein
MIEEEYEVHEMRIHTMGPPNVSGTNSWKSGACQSIAGSFLCRFGVLTADMISISSPCNQLAQRLTRALRLWCEYSSIRSLGRDCCVTSRRSYGPIRGCGQGRERRRVHIEAFFCILVLAEFGVVVDIGTGWEGVTIEFGRCGVQHLLFSYRQCP